MTSFRERKIYFYEFTRYKNIPRRDLKRWASIVPIETKWQEAESSGRISKARNRPRPSIARNKAVFVKSPQLIRLPAPHLAIDHLSRQIYTSNFERPPFERSLVHVANVYVRTANIEALGSTRLSEKFQRDWERSLEKERGERNMERGSCTFRGLIKAESIF